jgi:murein DD-endopeptidase MepM/ murein hydrolase activator NlpD
MSKLVAITGSAQGEMSGTPAPESAAKTESGEQTPSTVGLPSQQVGAIALSTGTAQAAELKAEAQRVKGYPGSAVVIASPESLTLAPGSILGISPDCVPDAFAREYRVSSATHTLSLSGFTSAMEFYTPQKPKAESGAINLTGDEVAPAGAPGKLLNPMPNSPRGTPFDPNNQFRRSGHRGIDLADFGAAAIFASEAGVVIDVENSCRVGDQNCGGGFGNLVFIRHTGQWDGWVTHYCHLSKAEVAIGQTVTKGQIIGRQGDTGFSFGAHLHYEVLNPSGAHVDPEPLIRPSPTGTYGEGAGVPIKT